jgi:hypothetical protein
MCDILEGCTTNREGSTTPSLKTNQWLYSDSGLCGRLALEENDDVLTEAGLKAHILDCLCGGILGHHIGGGSGVDE